MYKIRNTSGEILCLSLEKGSIILSPNQALDLDGICSRKWIREDGILKRLISSKHITLLHDSEVRVPQHPVKPVMAKAYAIKQGKKPVEVVEEPTIVDFSPDEVEEEEDELILKDFPDEPEEEEKLLDDEELFEDSSEDDVDEILEEAEEETPDNVCPICGKVCASERGLKVHMRVHEDKE